MYKWRFELNWLTDQEGLGWASLNTGLHGSMTVMIDLRGSSANTENLLRIRSGPANRLKETVQAWHELTVDSAFWRSYWRKVHLFFARNYHLRDALFSSGFHPYSEWTFAPRAWSSVRYIRTHLKTYWTQCTVLEYAFRVRLHLTNSASLCKSRTLFEYYWDKFVLQKKIFSFRTQ